jgi:outer membrane lipopolysaccharide assembly protein LptE/RlpB
VRAAALAALALVLAGCGYQVLGRGGSHRYVIGPVADDGGEPLFGADLRAALAREAVDRGDAALGASGEAGAYLLRARVVSIREDAVAYSVGDRARQYLLTAEAEATLEASDGRVVWKGVRIPVDREFPAGETVEDTENNKDVTLHLLAEELARAILRRASLALEARGR